MARRIGALVVIGSDRRVAGIISERDIIRVLAECGAAALEQPVGQVMTRKVVTCNRAETVSSIMELMTAGKFRHLPVVEEGQLVGIVSIGDVVKHRVQEIESESATLRDYIRTAYGELISSRQRFMLTSRSELAVHDVRDVRGEHELRLV